MTDIWEYEVNSFGGGNNELQMYVDSEENACINKSGNIQIKATSNHSNICGTKRNYTSGKIRTKRRFDFKYGTVEFWAKLPMEEGIWPAVWMLPTENTHLSWPHCGEIDIVEGRGKDGISHAIHYGQSDHKFINSTEINEWNKYELYWDVHTIAWKLNGKEVLRKHVYRPFNVKFHLIINMAVGGNFIGGRRPNRGWKESTMEIGDLVVK